MYSTNHFTGFTPEENLAKLYIEKSRDFRRSIENESQKTLEENLSSLKPKGILDRFFFVFDTDRSMQFYEISRVLEERASDGNNI